MRLLLWVGLCFSLSVTSVLGGVLVDQPLIDGLGNPHQGVTGVSSEDSLKIFSESQTFDNFVITEASEIDALHWYGSFIEPFLEATPRPNNEFQVQIIPDANNRPDVDAPLVAEFLLNGGTAGMNDGTDLTTSVLPDVSSRGNGAIVKYESDLDNFTLEPGTYWLSIQIQQAFEGDLDFDFPE